MKNQQQNCNSAHVCNNLRETESELRKTASYAEITNLLG